MTGAATSLSDPSTKPDSGGIYYAKGISLESPCLCCSFHDPKGGMPLEGEGYTELHRHCLVRLSLLGQSQRMAGHECLHSQR